MAYSSLVIVISAALLREASSCNEDQVIGCQEAAQRGRLSGLEGGGVCSQQQYVHYTHACTVTDYRNNVDYCCCAIATKVLCCRYHQAWDRFRCAEPEDTIATIDHRPTLPLEQMVPAVLIPLVLVLCCVVCCVRKYYRWTVDKRERGKSDGSSVGWPVPVSTSSTMPSYTSYTRIQRLSQPDCQPATTRHSGNGGAKPASIPERTLLEPSAPPGDAINVTRDATVRTSFIAPRGDSYSCGFGSDYIRGSSTSGTEAGRHSSRYSDASSVLNGAFAPVRHADSFSSRYAEELSHSPHPHNTRRHPPAYSQTPPATHACYADTASHCSACAAQMCAPPAYEDSLQHPVIQL